MYLRMNALTTPAVLFFIGIIFCLLPISGLTDTAEPSTSKHSDNITLEEQARIAPPLINLINDWKSQHALKQRQTEVLAKYVHVTLDETNKDLTTIYVAVAIEDIDAIRDYSEIELSFNRFYELTHLDFARVLTPKGELKSVSDDAIQIKTNRHDNFFDDTRILSFSLPNIEIGSVIEFQFSSLTKQNVIPNQWSGGAKGYWPQVSHTAQLRIDPVHTFEYQISVPEEQSLYFITTQPDLTQHKSFKDPSSNRTLYQWQNTELPEIVLEDSMPPIKDLWPVVKASSMPSWNTVDAWGSQMVEQAVSQNDRIKMLAQKIVQDADTQEEKARQIYDYLENNVRYVFAHINHGGFIPHPVEEVLDNGYGDCKDQTVLLISLLRAVGIEAYPALVSTRPIDFFPKVPVLQFDHMVTYLPKQPGLSAFWMDTASDKMQYPGMHYALQGSTSFILDGKGGQLLDIPLEDLSHHTAQVDITFTDITDRSADADIQFHFTGAIEERFRSWWRYQDDADKELKKFVQRFYHTELKVKDSESHHAESHHQDFGFSSNIQFSQIWEGGKLPLTLNTDVSQLLNNFTRFNGLDDPKNRTQDYVITQGYQLILNTHFIPPAEGFAPTLQASGIPIKNSYFEFQPTMAVNGDEITVSMTLSIPEQTISVKQYPDFYQSIQALFEQPSWVVAYQYDPISSEQLALERKIEHGQLPLNETVSLIRLYLDKGDFEQALTLCEQLIEQNPDQGEIYYLKGLATGYLDQFSESDKAFEQASQLGYRI